MFRTGTATSTDPLRAVCPPPSRQFSKLLYLSVTFPAAMHRTPLLPGVGIDDDGFARDLCQFADEAADQFGARAIDADADDLVPNIEQLRTFPERLSVGDVRFILTRKADVNRQIRIWL